MESIAAQLSPADLARFSCTCRYARALCWDAAPGLRLSLYPHQVCPGNALEIGPCKGAQSIHAS